MEGSAPQAFKKLLENDEKMAMYYNKEAFYILNEIKIENESKF